MIADVEALMAEVRREDPQSWHLLEEMMERMPRWAKEADATGEIPQDYWSAAPIDLQNRINIPTMYGGVRLTATAVRRAVVFERIGRICPAFSIALPGPGLSAPPVLALGTDAQKVAYFGRFVEQKRPVWGAFAITEPQSGSDATAMRTVAKRSGDHYVLNGNKCFITNGRRADVTIVFATVDPAKGRFGIRAFIVPKGVAGFDVEASEGMMGLRASQLVSLSFTDCAVPAENMLGHNGKRGPLIDAFAGAQDSWDYMRPVLTSLICGNCRGMLDYVDKRLAEKDAELTRGEIASVQEELRYFRAYVHSARLLAIRAAWKYDNGQPASTDASLAKAFASSLAMELAHRLATFFPMHAGTTGHPIEKFYRDAKAFDILEGTGDMQRLMISRTYMAAAA